MRCQLCHQTTPNRWKVSIYGDGIWVCLDCYEQIQANRRKPYSKVMDKVAMLEAGYHVNRKLARMYKS
jgi:ribosome-binding protein aMBF1 (putative translation factor)